MRQGAKVETRETIGTCSECRGRVTRPYPVLSPDAPGKCDTCGAVTIGYGPLLPMGRNS